MPANLENSAVVTGLEKVSFHSNPKERQLQQYVNHELPDVQDGFRKGRGTRDKIANIHWIIKKAREFQKNKVLYLTLEKAVAPHSSTLAWKIP